MKTSIPYLVLLAAACAGATSAAQSSTVVPRRCGSSNTGDSGLVTLSIEPSTAHHDYSRVILDPDSSSSADPIVLHTIPPVDTPLVLAPGLYRLRILALGYKTARDTLRVGAGEAWCVAAQMAPADPLEPVF